MEEAEKPAEKPPRRRMKRRVWVILAVLIALAVFGIRMLSAKEATPLPKELLSQIDFGAYFPDPMPNGLQFVAESPAYSGGVLAYNVRKTDGTDIAISMQKLDSKFNPQLMFSKNPVPTSTTKIGTSYNLSSKEQSRYMITANNTTLIFVSTEGLTDDTTMVSIVESLKEISPAN